MPQPNIVRVRISPGNPPVVYPESAYLSLGRDEEIVWECKGKFKVIFKAASPFVERVFEGSGQVHSGRARSDVGPDYKTRYRYSVHADGWIDPEVIVGQ